MWTAGDRWTLPQGFTYQFSAHAVTALLDCKLTHTEVLATMPGSEVLESYPPKGYPYWNFLLHTDHNSRQLHVVIALIEDSKLIRIVTVYDPDLLHWHEGFKRRKK
jgi:hypothetical protein